MSDLAQAFLERWTEENATAVPAADRQAEAERLATVCREEAAEEGITEAELDEAAVQSSDEEHSDLISYMSAALDAAAAADEEYADNDDEEEDA